MLNTATFARLANKGLFSLFFTGLLKLASLLKVSFIVGSFTAFFSITSMIMPLAGAFGGLSGAIFVTALGLGLKYALGGALTLKFLAYYIPGMCAALYWSSHLLMRILMPLTAIVLFISNPIGHQVWAYSLFWLIPMVIALLNKKSLFLQALASTFTAHAIGTVIWIWAVPTTPAFWLMLVPLVIIERLVYALGMVMMHKVLSYSVKAIGRHAWFLRLAH